ncbi:hypothetical protein KR200_002769, partial [Drosophila serrata]
AGSNYSLWKVTRSYKRQATPKLPVKKKECIWARSAQDRVEAFAQNLEGRLTFLATASARREKIVDKKHAITHNGTNAKKAPGEVQIDNRVSNTLPFRGLLYLILTFNASLKLSYFP